MSFGFGVGDFIAVIKLANKIRKEFAGAPAQFKEVSEEVRSLSIVLQDVDVALSENDLSSSQRENLENIASGCKSVLDDLQTALYKYCELGTKTKDLSKTAKRTWKRLTWEPNDIRDLRYRITSNTALLSSFIQQCTSSNVVKLVKKQDDREHREILDWLTPLDYATQQADFISRRQPGTGKWLLNSPEYWAWMRTGKQTLFCPGIPGAGKTILSCTIIDDLSIRYRDDPNVGIAYLYFNFRRQTEQKVIDLESSLLKQLAQSQPSLPGAVKDLYNRHKQRRSRPSEDELLEALRSITTLYSRVFIIVDALDECETSQREKLLSGLFDLQEEQGVNILATSRFIPEIVGRFTSCKSLEIRASEEDVRIYLEGHMKQLPSFVHGDADIRHQIITTISETADGMFLLAQIYLGSLSGEPTKKAIKVALRDFQKQSQHSSRDGKTQLLTDAYGKAMETISSQKQGLKDLAIQVLSWITCASRPLFTLELQHALAIEIGKEELDEDNIPDIELVVTVCAGLVTIDEGSDIIRLVHHTTQEYFETTQGQWFPEAQCNIAKICITYLSFKDISPVQPVYQDELYPFHDYATRYWGHHVRRVPKPQEQILQPVLSLLRNPRLVAAVGWRLRLPPNISGTHLAAYFGLEEALNYMITDRNVDIEDLSGNTPLLYAVQYRHGNVLRLLLEKGADIERKGRYSFTPLMAAAHQGHEAAVRLLLENGADIEIRERHGYTPLRLAGSRRDLPLTRLLLEKRAKTETKDNHTLTPLQAAVEYGYLDIVQLLLEKGANIKGVNIDCIVSDGITPLCFAVYYLEDNDMAKLLLDKGANIEAMGLTDGTSLSSMMKWADMKMIRLLLDHCASTKEMGTLGETSNATC